MTALLIIYLALLTLAFMAAAAFEVAAVYFLIRPPDPESSPLFSVSNSGGVFGILVAISWLGQFAGKSLAPENLNTPGTVPDVLGYFLAGLMYLYVISLAIHLILAIVLFLRTLWTCQRSK